MVVWPRLDIKELQILFGNGHFVSSYHVILDFEELLSKLVSSNRWNHTVCARASKSPALWLWQHFARAPRLRSRATISAFSTNTFACPQKHYPRGVGDSRQTWTSILGYIVSFTHDWQLLVSVKEEKKSRAGTVLEQKKKKIESRRTPEFFELNSFWSTVGCLICN